MTVTIEDNIRENPALFAVVTRAQKALEDIVEHSLLDVSATWCFVEDQRHRQFIELKLSDPLASLSRLFSPEDLAHPDQWGSPLSRFWSDFLNVLSRKHLLRLHQLVAELDKE